MFASQRVRSSQREWCDRNSRPKTPFVTPFTRPEPTRWQKPGPMDRNDWASFHKNYQATAAYSVPHLRNSQNIRFAGGRQCKTAKHWQEEQYGQDRLRQNLQELSMPKWQRCKYNPPPQKEFPYRPQITGRLHPKPEKGRPTRTPIVPCCFQHEEIEHEFWSNMRFPVSRKALRAVASKKVRCLAQPKCHCQCSMDDQFVPKRQKMTPCQWRSHQQRLLVLSKPNPRVLADLMYPCL